MSNIVKFDSPIDDAHGDRQVLDPRDVQDMLDRESRDSMIVACINGQDVTHGEMKAAFEMVCDKENWKNPIDVRIDNPGDQKLEIIKDAVMYFAGCTAYFRPVGDTIHVTAKGYYIAMGA
jgi:hypothetical protein